MSKSHTSQFDLSGEQRKAVAVTAGVVAKMTDRHNADPCATIPLRASMWDGDHGLGRYWRSKIGIPRVGGVYVTAYADGAVYVGSTMDKSGGISKRFERRAGAECHAQRLADHGGAAVLFAWSVEQLRDIHPQEAERLAIAGLKIAGTSGLLNDEIPFPAGLTGAEWRLLGSGVIDANGIELTNNALNAVATAARKFQREDALSAVGTSNVRRALNGLTLLTPSWHPDEAFFLASATTYDAINVALGGIPLANVSIYSIKGKPQYRPRS